MELDTCADIPFPFNLCWQSIQEGSLFSSRESRQLADHSPLRAVEPLPVLEVENPHEKGKVEWEGEDSLVSPSSAAEPVSPSLVLVQREKKGEISPKIPSASVEKPDFVEGIAQNIPPELLPSEDLMTNIAKIEMFAETPILEKAPVAMQVGKNVGKTLGWSETQEPFPRLAHHLTGPGMNAEKEGKIVPLQEEATSPSLLPADIPEITPLQEGSSREVATPLPEEIDFSRRNVASSAKPILEEDDALRILSMEDLPSSEIPSLPPKKSNPSQLVSHSWEYAKNSPHFGLPQPVRIGSESTEPGLVLLPDETGLARKEPVNFPPVE
ncbi:MAG: hypothetical protein Q4D62_14895 [Planctomycetia bacterium]|nr:hypothetical protein [Planctomycetia bacterium]